MAFEPAGEYFVRLSIHGMGGRHLTNSHRCQGQSSHDDLEHMRQADLGSFSLARQR